MKWRAHPDGCIGPQTCRTGSLPAIDNLPREGKMKKHGIFMKVFGGGLAVAAFAALAGQATAGAVTDITGMMDEGISYASAASGDFTVKHDNRADMEAMLVEGIVYQESVVSGDAPVIRLNHQQTVLQGMESCLCEDPPSL
jgi:hypothetical protein